MEESEQYILTFVLPYFYTHSMKVMVFGTFDDLHPGHRYLLDRASKRGELFVIVARDANVLKFKHRGPLQSEDERVKAIQDAYPDAHVTLGDAHGDYLAHIREVKPDLILLGYDQKLPPNVSVMDLGTKVDRLDAFEPEVHKSSLRREKS